MTEHEIEKLREKLGSEYSVKRLNGAITVELVDIWNGVEFAECLESVYWYTKGNIYPVTGITLSVGLCYVDTLFDDKGNRDNGLVQRYAKPSTEAAYVEQLKAKAKELYGEIKDGDRFDLSMLGGYVEVSVGNSNKSFTYQKLDDKLYFGDIPIYQQGKWAKKVERVRVVPSEIHYPKPHLDQYVTVELRVIGGILDASKSNIAAKELAKCLEDYLNKIP